MQRLSQRRIETRELKLGSRLVCGWPTTPATFAGARSTSSRRGRAEDEGLARDAHADAGQIAAKCVSGPAERRGGRSGRELWAKRARRREAEREESMRSKSMRIERLMRDRKFQGTNRAWFRLQAGQAKRQAGAGLGSMLTAVGPRLSAVRHSHTTPRHGDISSLATLVRHCGSEPAFARQLQGTLSVSCQLGATNESLSVQLHPA